MVLFMILYRNDTTLGSILGLQTETSGAWRYLSHQMKFPRGQNISRATNSCSTLPRQFFNNFPFEDWMMLF